MVRVQAGEQRPRSTTWAFFVSGVKSDGGLPGCRHCLVTSSVGSDGSSAGCIDSASWCGSAPGGALWRTASIAGSWLRTTLSVRLLWFLSPPESVFRAAASVGDQPPKVVDWHAQLELYHPLGLPAGGRHRTSRRSSASPSKPPWHSRRCLRGGSRRAVDGLTSAELDRVCGRKPADMYPEHDHVVRRCLKAVLTEEAAATR